MILNDLDFGPQGAKFFFLENNSLWETLMRYKKMI
jgi:hypothetical protein